MIFTNVNDEVQNKSLAKDIQFCIEYAKKNENKILSLVHGSYDVEYNDIKMNVGKYFFMPTGEQPPLIYPVSGSSSFMAIRSQLLLPVTLAVFFRSSSAMPGMTQTK